MPQLTERKLRAPLGESVNITDADLFDGFTDLLPTGKYSIYDLAKWTVNALNGVDARVTYEASDLTLSYEILRILQDFPDYGELYKSFKKWLSEYTSSDDEAIAYNAETILRLVNECEEKYIQALNDELI